MRSRTELGRCTAYGINDGILRGLGDSRALLLFLSLSCLINVGSDRTLWKAIEEQVGGGEALTRGGEKSRAGNAVTQLGRLENDIAVERRR